MLKIGYQRRMNVENRTIFQGDNLYILRGLDSETIDLIYLDPPFNSNRTYEAPIGSEAAGAAFKDAWTLRDLDNAWHGELAEHEPALYSAISAAEFSHSPSMKAYLIMMGIRMLEMRRVLKTTGSIYLHCDPTASHYLKMMMDSVFGWRNFRNEIAWDKYAGRKNNARKKFNTQQDTILYYAYPSATFSPQYGPLSESAIKEYRHKDDDGRLYRFARRGKGYESAGGNRRIYLDENPGNVVGSLWISKDLQLAQSSKERTGFPTQKPLSLLERIIKASTSPGDIVLDPFCGCATTCIAAESLQRQWIGIDLSPKAVELVKMRLERDLNIHDYEGLLGDKVIHRTDIPVRDVPDEPRQIHAETLFGTQSGIERVLSQVELRQYRSYKHTLFGLQEGKCNGCEVLFPFRNMTIDHIIPRSKGGTDDPDNLQLLCGACNSTKGYRTQDDLIVSLREQGVLRE